MVNLLYIALDVAKQIPSIDGVPNIRSGPPEVSCEIKQHLPVPLDRMQLRRRGRHRWIIQLGRQRIHRIGKLVDQGIQLRFQLDVLVQFLLVPFRERCGGGRSTAVHVERRVAGIDTRAVGRGRRGGSWAIGRACEFGRELRIRSEARIDGGFEIARCAP